MAVDLSVLDGYKTIVDQQQLQDAFELKKALAGAEIQKAMTPEFNLAKLGQQALVKKQLGIPTSAEEDAYANVYSATTEGVYTDLYGNSVRKPGVMERLGVPQSNNQPSGITGSPPPNLQPMSDPQANETITDLFGNGNNTGVNSAPPPALQTTLSGNPAPVSNIPPNAGMDDAPNEWDLQYQKQRADLLARGDKRSAQALDLAYSKSKLEMNDVQGKAASFADRMFLTNPILEKTTPAGIDSAKVRIDRNLPDFIANPIVGGDYQSFNREQRDFINAQLRRESGAVISPVEFDNAAKQYIPQVGDGPDVLARKKAAREQAASNMAREAGPAYKRAKQVPTKDAPKYKEGAIADGPNGEILIFMNGAWKPYKGKK